LSNVASLIARYATGAILPQVVGKFDLSIGKWGCAIQAPILAYILRVSPALARPRIEQAIAARGTGYSECNHELFQDVSEIHYDPVLQDIAIRSLDDSDPQVAMTAATMLGDFGSADVESVLWQHYADWSAQWVGRESELDLTFAEMGSNRVYDLGLGENLLRAIVTGKAWLTDVNKLERLAQLTTVTRLQQMLDGDLKIWTTQPLTISFNHNLWPVGFDARVAQYELHSIGALESKIEQFPPGTRFFISTPPMDSPANGKSRAELRSFLQAHGMFLAGERRAY